MPEFSRKTKDALESQKISKGTRSEIVTCLGFEIWRHSQYPTGDEYNAVCSMLVTAYPILKDTIGNGYVSITTLMLQDLNGVYRVLGNYNFARN